MSRFKLDVSPTSFAITDDKDRDLEFFVRDDGTLHLESISEAREDRNGRDTYDYVNLDFDKEQAVDVLAAFQAWLEQLTERTT